MKKICKLAGTVLAVILMALIGLISTSNAEEVTSPPVLYFFQPKEFSIYVSGSRPPEQKENIVAKVTFGFGSYSFTEKLPVPVLPVAKDPHTDDVGSQSIRDLIVTPAGEIRMLVGTFKPKIMSFDSGTKAWSTVVDGIKEWGLQNNGSAGGFSSSENGDLFLPGMWIVGSQTGIYKTSSDGKLLAYFEKVFWPMDVCVSNDTVYIVEDGQKTAKVTLLNEKTGELKKEVPLPPADHRAVTVSKDGFMFVADYSGLVTHIDSSGKIIGQTIVMADTYGDQDLRAIHLSDIDLSPDGQYLAIGSCDGYVGVMSADLKNIHLLRLGPFSFSTFVAWPP
jgi:WD40 repeat protein